VYSRDTGRGSRFGTWQEGDTALARERSGRSQERFGRRFSSRTRPRCPPPPPEPGQQHRPRLPPSSGVLGEQWRRPDRGTWLKTRCLSRTQAVQQMGAEVFVNPV
jgi:hypothetical protein